MAIDVVYGVFREALRHEFEWRVFEGDECLQLVAEAESRFDEAVRFIEATVPAFLHHYIRTPFVAEVAAALVLEGRGHPGRVSGAIRNLVQDALAEFGDACGATPDSYVVLRSRCTHCDGTWEYLAPGYLWAVAEVGALEEGTCPRCRFE